MNNFITYNGTKYTAETIQEKIDSLKESVQHWEQAVEDAKARYNNAPVERRDTTIINLFIEDLKHERQNLRELIILAARL
jgi:archaellum component FlaC